MMKYNLNDLPEFPTYGLPMTVQAAINEVANARQCPIDYAVAPALIAIATAIGSRAVVVDSYRNRLNLFVGVVGESGQNKSTPGKDLLSPIEKIHGQMMADYERKKELLEISIEQESKKQVKAPKMPDPIQLMIGDATPEARLQALKANPAGLLWHRDELKGLFDDFGRYNNSGEASDLLTIFDGGSITKNRKGDGAMYVKNPFVSIFGTTQPEALTATFRNSVYLDSGLIPRFIWFYFQGRIIKKSREMREPNPDIMSQWGNYITAIFNEAEKATPDNPITIAVDKDSRELLHIFRDEVGNYYTGYEATIWNKLQIYLFKLAGIAAFARYADEEYLVDPTICTNDMMWAINCMYYLRHTALMVEEDCRAKQMVENQPPTKAETITALMDLFPNAKQTDIAKALNVSRQYVSRCANEGDRSRKTK